MTSTRTTFASPAAVGALLAIATLEPCSEMAPKSTNVADMP